MIVCTHWPVLPQESAIVYVRVIVLGHVPVFVWLTLNVLATNPQLSVADPPPAIKVASVANAGGRLPIHSKFWFAGHVITGAVVSSTMIVCTH